ncbi:hypothetical protein TNCV_649011 [Trichonephila clavipes]|nr:hypothetical protein TNCV_649011 [Trichonephila clavipes]
MGNLNGENKNLWVDEGRVCVGEELKLYPSKGSGDGRRVAIMDFGAPLTIGKAYLKIIMSSFLGFCEWNLETGGVMDKCVQMWTRNYGALGQTARCVLALCANRREGGGQERLW